MKIVCNRAARAVILAMCMIVAVTFMPGIAGRYEVQAADSMNTYDKIYKSGSTLYCMVDGSSTAGMFKVNLKTGKAKKVMKYSYGEGGSAGNMHLNKGYIYYTVSDDLSATLYRVRTTGKGGKALAKLALSSKYQIKGSKIYYAAWSDSEIGITKGTPRVMSLNGRNKKKAAGRSILMKSKASNTRGYKIVKKYDSKEYDYENYDPEEGLAEVKINYNYYLKKPDGKKIFLMKDFTWDYESI